MNEDILSYIEYFLYILLFISFCFMINSCFFKNKNNKTLEKTITKTLNEPKIFNKYEYILNKYNFEIIYSDYNCLEPYVVVNMNEKTKFEFEKNEPYLVLKEGEGQNYRIIFKNAPKIYEENIVKDDKKYNIGAVLFNKDNWFIILNEKLYSNKDNKICDAEYIADVNSNFVKIMNSDEEIIINY